MARYGKNWGQPFGAFNTSGFQGVFYYEGFTSVSGASAYSYSMVVSSFEHISGVSTFSGFVCSTTIPAKPILTGPLSSLPLSGDVYITWMEANPRDFDFGPLTYQIQYTDEFDDDRGWVDIISGIEQGKTSYVWNIRRIPRSKNIGIRMRAVDIHGNASEWDSLPDTFTVENHAPSAPILISPIERETFDDKILIEWEAVDPADFDGDKIFYAIEYSDKASVNENWVIVAEGIPYGVTKYEFGILDLSSGSDYGIRINAVDEYGLKSEYSTVKELTIFHHSVFLVDTTPPKGTLIINDNEQNTKTPDVLLTLQYTDETTAVKDVSFSNVDKGEITDKGFEDFVPISKKRYWRLDSNDGIKRVAMQLRDYANNMTRPIQKKGIFRKFSSDNRVDSLAGFVDSLWIGQQNGMIYDMQTVTALIQETGAVIYDMKECFGKMWIATGAKDSTGTIYFSDRYSIQISIKFSEIDSTVNALEKFDIAYTSADIDTFILFAGLDNGKIYTYQNGEWKLNYSHKNAINRLYNSGNQLFALTGKEMEYLVYDPNLNTWDIRQIVNV